MFLPFDKDVVFVICNIFVKFGWWLIIKNVVSGIFCMVSAICCCVCVSAPESGSSKIANFGFIKIKCNSIRRLRSPPEKPTLMLRFSHSFGMFNCSRADSSFCRKSPIGKS